MIYKLKDSLQYKSYSTGIVFKRNTFNKIVYTPKVSYINSITTFEFFDNNNFYTCKLFPISNTHFFVDSSQTVKKNHIHAHV